MICYECDSEVGHKAGCSLDLANWSWWRRWRHGVWLSRRAEYGRKGILAWIDGLYWAKIWGSDGLEPEEGVSDERQADLGWWVLSGKAVLDALRRAHNGEDPDLIYAELYANSDHEGVDDE